MSNHPDHPYVRALRECPVCDMRKELGRLTCAPCWATRNPDFVLRKVDTREREIVAEHAEHNLRCAEEAQAEEDHDTFAEMGDPCPERIGDGVAFISAKHPSSDDDISPEALEVVEIDLPIPRSIAEAYGGNAVQTDNLILSAQLIRIEFLLGEILAEMRK